MEIGKDFSAFLQKRLKGLPKPIQMMFIDEMVEAIKETVEALGLGQVEVKKGYTDKDGKIIPGSEEVIKDKDVAKDIIDLLKSSPVPQEIKDLIEGNDDISVHKLKGNDLEEFMNRLKEDGIEVGFEDMFKRGVKRDHSIKKIGDAVVVLDVMAANYMHDFDTKEQLSQDFKKPLHTFIDTPAIIVEVDTEFIFNCGHCDDEHKSDVVIFFPSLDKKYHAMSNSLRIL